MIDCEAVVGGGGSKGTEGDSGAEAIVSSVRDVAAEAAADGIWEDGAVVDVTTEALEDGPATAVGTFVFLVSFSLSQLSKAKLKE